ncbi:MAG: hypothetical protein IBJ02_01815 [Brevundimonas sp.]|nr:hypothetical protein [Brevundimonas sp.]
MQGILLILASLWQVADASQQTPPDPAPAPVSGTTREAADRACRGATWRRPGESRPDCIARLIETDALSRPLPVGNTPPAEECRRESGQNEQGNGVRFSVTCTTTVTVRPPDDD